MYIVEKRDFIGLNRDFDYIYKFWRNIDGADISNILDENGIVNISNMNFNNVLLEDFSNEANAILGPPFTLDLNNKSISNVEYKYHTRFLEYMVFKA